MQRVAAFLIAFALGGAPVAVEACQIACASAPHASCHEASGAPQHWTHEDGACHDHGGELTGLPAATPLRSAQSPVSLPFVVSTNHCVVFLSSSAHARSPGVLRRVRAVRLSAPLRV